MPYIKLDKRIQLQNTKLRDLHGLSAGELNYVMTSLLATKFIRNKCYDEANLVMGVLECIKQELYRKFIAPYEEQKIVENGDIALYISDEFNKVFGE